LKDYIILILITYKNSSTVVETVPVGARVMYSWRRGWSGGQTGALCVVTQRACVIAAATAAAVIGA